jgi:hypothetical protein
VTLILRTDQLPTVTPPKHAVFCSACVGRVADDGGVMREADGEPCRRCGGSGMLWYIPEPS